MADTTGMDNNSLIAALAADATSVGTTFIAADAAKSALPKLSPTVVAILVGGLVLIGIVFFMRK